MQHRHGDGDISLNLCLDIGNSKIRAAVFDNRRVLEDRIFMHSGKGIGPEMAAVIKRWAKRHRIEKAGMVSVVPGITAKVSNMINSALGISPDIVTGKKFPFLGIRYRFPERLGADRLINAYAAFKLYGGPAMVVDIGTAITWDAVDSGGRFLGGAIAPGPGAMAGALSRETAALPPVRLKDRPAVVGTDTEECIMSGIYWGTVGMIRELITRTSAGMKRQPKVIFTGGLGTVFAREFKYGLADELLTLKGIDLFLNDIQNISKLKYKKRK
jgi:type III pantothenate kinase